MPRAYLHYDVFTDEPFTGNQLAVFLDDRGLDTARMQAIAREMSFSESTFILPAEDAGTNVRMRIFTPGTELPMAGHPTIGSTFALAHAGVIEPGADTFVFGLGVGPTPVSLEWAGRTLRFAWMTQRAPEFGAHIGDRQSLAAALGVRRDDLAGDVPIQRISCGVPYVLVPMTSREAVDRAVSDAHAIRRLGEATGIKDALFLFTLDRGSGDDPATSAPGAAVYARMFAPQFGIPEDAATGSAAGPLGCYLVHYGLAAGGAAGRIVALQGQAMGRPSRLHIRIAGTRERITRVEVGGTAVLVARGELLVD